MEGPEPLPLSEIPTLSLLYKLKKLAADPEVDSAELPAPSATFNDKISVIRHDITLLAIDSIVNAANESLMGGGGVDGAIHRAAGPDLLDECETLDGCPTGYAKITDGYELPAKKVIHAVGPRYWASKKEGAAEELLAGCYWRSLELAVENDLKSIAFSALSTGIYGYPSGEASEVALATVRKFLDEGKGDSLERIIFCNFMEKDEKAYFANIPLVFPPVVPEEKEEDTEKTTEETDLASKLPDAPTTEPVEEGEPEPKKQKVSTDSAAEVAPASKEVNETANEATSKTGALESKP
ncbi:A1pp-domain-containing protein [Lophium mytilinum]|uniref:A1pp-domain-containing protein n=1 Tax=Lophium mytilinum TaxID=390894 RepID=A0A6A6REQ6_9PEZI|nr:A1pp-domain-containing protein [Lophium mytilinum]